MHTLWAGILFFCQCFEPPQVSIGDDTAEKIFNQVLATTTICRQHLTNKIPMKWLTQEQWSEYNNATNCSICTKPLNPADKKVLNHNHLTEEYRCPAHNTCNLNYHIHAFLFNIKNYLCEVRNIQRRKAELNVNLPRVNNSDIKQNGMEEVIQVACVVSWTSIFFCQIIVVAGFFICWLEWLAIS